MAQIRPITSEQLESTVRRLLPSQNGFGEDLQAQNVVVPVIDLTPTAEGSFVRQDLQTAGSFTDANVFEAVNATDVIANTPGFWLISYAVSISGPPATGSVKFQASDGLSTKDILSFENASGNTQTVTNLFGGSFVWYLRAGESISIISNNGSLFGSGYCRQIADVNGVLNNPTGFVSQ